MDILKDYLEFHKIQSYSTDMDPAYPVLKNIVKELKLTKEQGVWLTFVYVAYYHIGSALKVFEQYPEPFLFKDSFYNLPCTTERRGHRKAGNLKRHIKHIVDKAEWEKGLHRWLSEDLCLHPKMNWELTQDKLLSIWGNGRWASYKTGEVLWKVNEYNLEATDMGHAHSSGPRKGLELLFPSVPTGNSALEVKKLNMLSEKLVRFMNDKGYKATIETAETSLCDFNSFYKGKYYTGIDIDHMQEDLLKVPSIYTDLAFESRKKYIPNEYLGELNGWIGVRKEKKKQYAIKQISN